jgi:hypothetical protein
MEGTRKSPRLEATKDVKIAKKTINRAGICILKPR